MTGLSLKEWTDYRELYKLEQLLGLSAGILRLNLPSRIQLLEEIKAEKQRLLDLDKERKTD